MLEYVVVEYQNREHSTTQRNHSCTKQQTKYVPIRVRIKRCMYVLACDVRVVFLEHGALDSCKSPVCTFNVGPSSVTPIHSSLCASVAGGTARYAKRLVSPHINIYT